MDYLLDTHIFLWYISGNEKLNESYKEVIENSENNVFISTYSIWEMIIKTKLGKLPLPSPAYNFITGQLNNNLKFRYILK